MTALFQMTEDKNPYQKLDAKYGKRKTMDNMDDVAASAPVTEAPRPDATIPDPTWKDSQAVRLLHFHLKKHKDDGIFLRISNDGRPVLQFMPAITGIDADQERFDIAVEARYLLLDALPDLTTMITSGSITLQQIEREIQA